MREDVTSQPHAENTGVSQPLSLSRSMRDIALSLAEEMSRP
jgi:hypothetical protein